MNSTQTEQATFASGCFWCTEAVFRRLKGVRKVVSGYTGGTVKNPAYREVCAGTTGHAEAITIEFAPKEITYTALLEVFFATHDPTTLNRQGHDIGTQYRSAIFFHNEAQENAARKAIAAVDQSNIYDSPIVTEVVPAEEFYVAEAEHHAYYENHANERYCQLVIQPKVDKLHSLFSNQLKKDV